MEPQNAELPGPSLDSALRSDGKMGEQSYLLDKLPEDENREEPSRVLANSEKKEKNLREFWRTLT